jgi:hypothetical protein
VSYTNSNSRTQKRTILSFPEFIHNLYIEFITSGTVMICGMRSLVIKPGNLTRLIIHSPTVRAFPDQSKLFS